MVVIQTSYGYLIMKKMTIKKVIVTLTLNRYKIYAAVLMKHRIRLYILLELSYVKVERSCYGNDYDTYNTLEKATSACSSDDNCQAVYDFKCDNKGTFTLCSKDVTLKSSSTSCAYIDQSNVI